MIWIGTLVLVVGVIALAMAEIKLRKAQHNYVLAQEVMKQVESARVAMDTAGVSLQRWNTLLVQRAADLDRFESSLRDWAMRYNVPLLACKVETKNVVN